MKKKLLALFLCCVMVFSLVPVALTTAFAAGSGLQIYGSDGALAETVQLEKSEKTELTAVAETGSGNYQWQIHVSDDVWANIVGTNGNTLELSYGLVANALDNDAAEIRCKLTNDVGNVSYSNIVTVQIQPDSVLSAAAASSAAGTVISEAQPVGEPVIVPADTPAGFSAPAAASDPASADDPAPVSDPPANDVPADETPANDTPTPTTYTILINYIFADGKQAAPSWSATVATGSTYTQDIQSPVVVGYTPSETVVHVNTSEANTYTVTYQPAEVEFTVKHYQQNVSNDEYTLADTETKKDFTESAVGAGLAKTDYTGFYPLLYDTTTTIAADGSTVVEVYYDRYYYLMNFNLDGGYGVEPIYARFGAPISVDESALEKPGYTFGGWNETIPATMPAQNTTYTATWNKSEGTAFTVAFYYENADDKGYTFMGSKVYQGTTGDRVSGFAYKDENFSGKDTKHFTYLDGKTDKNVEIKGDGSTVVKVYFSRNVYTMSFYGITCGRKENWGHSHSRDKCCKTVTDSFSAKYNANIAQQYARITQNHRWIRWDAGACTALVSYMPDNSNPDALKYWQGSDGSTVYNITYAYESENGTINHDGKKFTALATSNVPMSYVGYDADYKPGVRNGYSAYEDYGKAARPRFSDNGQIKDTIFNEKTNVTLFYYANTYTLRFMNAETELKTADVKYNFSIKSNSGFTPDESYAPNGMVFDCWCLDPVGAQPVDWSTQKMPAGDLVLYARWKPLTHTVNTYLTKADMDEGKAPTNTWTAVPHGTAVTNPPAAPVNGQYTFVGWFYISDTGEEKAFDFSMPVNRDLNLYAKWSSNTLMNYTVKYELEDGTEIAPSTTGSALAGSTKTFNAKTGTQLKEGYQSGYFPKVSSHSITIDIEDTSKNEYTFVYVEKDKVEYTVRYLDKATGEPVVVNGAPTPDKKEKTRDAVVTETFKQITGYAPDAYQKQLVLAAENNEIIFWYVKDDVHAPVRVIHWQQNIEGDGYTERQSSTNLNGVIGTEYSETPLTIAGFTYNGTRSNASGKLTAAGLVLNLYYDRIEYPYEFRFVEKDSNPEKEIAPSVTGTARYQKQVTQRAKDIPGYTLVSTENQAIHIAIEDGETVVKNVKIFYYTEQTVDIKYEVVGPTECGTLNNYQETQLKVTTGEVKGSAPTAAEGFKFVGWYKDEDCTRPVDAEWVNDSKLTPGKTKNYGTNEAPVMGYEAATYYAKFEYDVADLTIYKKGWEGIDEGQSFLFDVTGPDEYKQRVVINGNGAVTIKGLKIGEYTVTEVTSWSWRYTTTSSNLQSITLQPEQTNAVTFENTRSKEKWLGGDAYFQNIFKNIFGN